jgi:phosphoribosylanthranilate isomerase
MQVKVCGITKQEQANILIQMSIDYIGFIFYAKSPRLVQQKIDIAPGNKKIVGVFVNPTDQDITNALQIIPTINTLQLHGEEMPDFCKKYRNNFKIIKAFSIEDAVNINTMVATYFDVVDLFLFDTKTINYGGSGQQFNWDVLKTYSGNVPFLLSGGIGIKDINKLQQLQHPQFIGVDVNSKMEISAGVKDLDLVNEFVVYLNNNK